MSLSRRASAIAILVSLALLAACDNTPRPTPLPDSKPASPRVNVAPRLDVSRGRSLVFMLDPINVRADVRSVRLADGRSLAVKIHRVTRDAGAAGAADPLAVAWTAASRRWKAQPAEQPVPKGQTPAMRAALVEVPADAGGSTIWINGEPQTVNWLPDADEFVPWQPAYWPPMLPDWARGHAKLQAMLRDVAASPLQRWRVRLLIDGLLEGGVKGEGVVVAFDDPVIEAMAAQVERAWCLALARLSSIDRDLATELKQRLAAVADFGDGMIAPAWPVDQPSLDRLLSDLLNAGSKPEVVAARAREWLDLQPQGAIRVLDDGGVIAPDGTPVAFVSVTNLSSKSMAAWAWTGLREPAAPEMKPLAAWGSVTLVPTPGETSPDDPPQAPAAVREAHVQVGRRAAEVPVSAQMAAVTPPGATLEGFAPDLSLQSWLYATAEREESAWTTTALLYKPPPRADRPAGVPPAWEVYVECRTAAGEQEGESVTLAFGEAASNVVRVEASGKVTLNGSELPDAAVSRKATSWAFRIEVPAGAIEREGRVRLGMLRMNAMGRRSAWPRPLLPWQTLPSRRVFDLTAWNQVR